MADNEQKPGTVTAAVTRAELAERRAKEAEEDAAMSKLLLKKEMQDDRKEEVDLEKWKTLRELVTGPNLKWIMAALVIIALVSASIFSGKVFTVSQGGIVFGAGEAPPPGDLLKEEEDAATPLPEPVEAPPVRVWPAPAPTPAPVSVPVVVPVPAPVARRLPVPVVVPVVEPEPEPPVEDPPEPEEAPPAAPPDGPVEGAAPFDIPVG